jgi:rhodanese-related sulfurtransferase
MSILQSIFNKKEEMNYKELVKNGVIIIDVRSEEEFRNGHVKGAINIPLDQLSSNLIKVGDKNKHIITCCMSGGRSGMAKNILHAAGYKNVQNGGGWHTLQSKLQ